MTGDSLATYVGLQLTNLTDHAGLVTVSLLDRNGTGLTNPSFFNWQKAARTDMAKRHPDVVIMVIGGNDGWPMNTPGGDRVQVGSDAWVDEYARRAAAVMRHLPGRRRAVYWSGPPTARANGWDALYRKINRADRAAAAALPGAQYVDLYAGTAVDGQLRRLRRRRRASGSRRASPTASTGASTGPTSRRASSWTSSRPTPGRPALTPAVHVEPGVPLSPGGPARRGVVDSNGYGLPRPRGDDADAPRGHRRR